ncbi:MAG: pyrimidine 5'-nucleotidase [Pseudomonadota bacterium]
MTAHSAFEGVTHWVFDLDNTLYPAGCNLFAQIDAKMAQFIEERFSIETAEARKMQKSLYVEHGTTLAGLMNVYDVDPHEFMGYVHDIDVSALTVDPRLKPAIQALPGKKFVHTNGSLLHADNVLKALDLTGVMDDIFDVEMGDWVPKPHASNYDRFQKRTGLNPQQSAMFEDMVVNLEVPHAMGMRTVLITSDADWIEDEPEEKRPGAGHEGADHVHHVTSDLTAFLEGLTTDERKTA